MAMKLRLIFQLCHGSASLFPLRLSRKSGVLDLGDWQSSFPVVQRAGMGREAHGGSERLRPLDAKAPMSPMEEVLAGV